MIVTTAVVVVVVVAVLGLVALVIVAGVVVVVVVVVGSSCNLTSLRAWSSGPQRMLRALANGRVSGFRGLVVR